MNKIVIAKVVVRIPPPTELGDAPINIKKETSNNVEIDNAPLSIVCKPALRDVADKNIELKKPKSQLFPLKK